MKVTSMVQSLKLELQHTFTRMRKSPFVKNVFVVMSGTTFAQLIGFALSPIISRLFSPSDFGVFGSFNSVLTIIAAGATLEYTQAIMLPREKEDALNLFLVSCLCALCIGFLCLALCLAAPHYINDLMKTTGVWPLALLVLSTIAAGLNRACQAWSVRIKAFRHTSGSQIIRSLSSNAAQIGLGYFNAGATGLIISTVLADIFASLNLIRVLIPDVLALRCNIQWTRMKQLAKEYRDFPMYSASQNVMNALSSGLPVLLLTHFYGIFVAGGYAFGVRIIKVPMNFMLTALRQVLFQKAAETQHKGGSLLPLYVKVTVALFALALIPSAVLLIWAPPIFTHIFGSEWRTAGEFTQSLIIWFMFVFCNLPAVLFARLIRIQRLLFLYDLGLLTGRTLSLVLGGLYLSATMNIMLFSLMGAGMNLFLIILVGHSLMKRERLAHWHPSKSAS